MATTTAADCIPESALSETVSMSGEEDVIEDTPTNGLHYSGSPFDLEKHYDYEAGGHHPVHLGDTFGNGRYRVIHKLGSGGTGNVWLCRDLHAGTPTYVALKILMAEVSTADCPELVQGKLLKGYENSDGAEAICHFLDLFNLDGPNGTHFCFVYPLLGPKVSRGQIRTSADPDKTLREMCRVTVQALAFLHSKSICHGDFTTNNVLRRISGLDGQSEQEVLEILGLPIRTDLITDSGQPHTLTTAPKYAVYPVNWTSVDTKYFTNEPQVNDLGEAFRFDTPPEYLGIPLPYRSPELLLEKDCSNLNGFASDLWALGCTLFEMRTGQRLFDCFDDDDDEYLIAMAYVLGKMPEPWWSTTWEARKRLFKDEADSLGRVVSARVCSTDNEEPNPKAMESTVHPSVAGKARSLRDKLASDVWYEYLNEAGKRAHREISEKEKDLLADLIALLLKWQPEERLSAEEALKHEWFNM